MVYGAPIIAESLDLSAACRKLRKQKRPHSTIGNLRCFARLKECGAFSLCCVYTLGTAWGEYSVGVLEYAVAEEEAEGIFDNFSSEPIVIQYSISKSWKTCYNLVIEVCPRQGLITDYNGL